MDTLGTKRSSNCQNCQVHIQILACGLNLNRSKEICITRQFSEGVVPYAFLARLSWSVMSCKSDYSRFSLLQQVTPWETPVPCHLLFSSLVTKGRSSSLFRIQIFLPGKNVSHLWIKLFAHSYFTSNTIFCASKWSWEITLF